ncbi:MAG: phosphopantothenoylcysteine decarboxylase domain-containing protein [Planctomycetota bacterium]|jgi:phosphopantothenoylcysteine synthetase/decarboxylase
MDLNRIEIDFIVTSGGTREPIDDVRYIGNASTGRLGAAVAGAARAKGHGVTFIHAEESALPSCREEIALSPFVTFAELKAALESRVRKARPPAVVVHAAAVADYLPDRSAGKIPSDQDELVIRMKRAEKIVDLIKTWNPDVHLVKFKLESNRTRDELLEIGRETGGKSKADWVVANDIQAISGETHPALILDSDGNHFEAGTKEEIAVRLVESVEMKLIGS